MSLIDTISLFAFMGVLIALGYILGSINERHKLDLDNMKADILKKIKQKNDN